VTIEGVSTKTPLPSTPPLIINTVQTNNMTKQQSFQAARNVITAKRSDVTRKGLQDAAKRMGRTGEQVAKASTMRLAFWASVGKSAI
jgi:GTP cyclohydrolase I